MLHEEKFVAAATEALRGDPEVHCKARMKMPGDYMGKSGLVAARDRRLVFVEEKILEPGEVTVIESDGAGGAKVEQGILGDKVTLEVEGGEITFEEVEKGKGQLLLSAVGVTGGMGAGGKGGRRPRRRGRGTRWSTETVSRWGFGR